ncbi:M1 family aminopeptidase [Mucilaginibacter sp. SMC90]|uniref:M1 family aminopeptidase n=1 Tax=Mucilaginibacter sp. SMC90 TaxID=2929803 RepID=UPI001FB1FDCE|nr:M1 family aminopeptidase [Mucilaginibacter sp. SMC90]UOE52867.1 M1 family aminopeptidase [Mucilaginibacter sp. SMC90]
MKILFTVAAMLLSQIFVSAQESHSPVEPGVPLSLAQYRKTIVHDIKYTIAFKIPGARKEPIDGNVEIDFRLSDIARPLQIDFKGSAQQVKSIKVNGNMVKISLEQEHILIAALALRKGSNHIEIGFTAGDASLNRNADYVYALFVPDHARTVFPCFDQPDLKAVFDLTLSVPEGWKVLANGALKDSLANGIYKTYHFKPSDQLPTYLFSFTAGKYSRTEQDYNGRKMEFLYRETDEQKIKLSRDSIFELHGQAIDFLEKWTGISYPFQKIGFVAIPDFQFGGMEHPGEVQYKASSLFLDETATKEQLISRVNLISHETAHMWFGDMVTMRWFNDVWMKEVFANFMADKVTQKLMGTETFNLKFLQDHYPAAYAVDRTEGANPIRQQLDNLQDAGSMYGNIIYHKAPIMMRQLEQLMGEESFQAGIREYLRKYTYGNAGWPELIACLSHHTTAKLNTWNKVWVNETGRPVIGADIRFAGDKISSFSIFQHPEQGAERIWPQAFDVTLVYADHQVIIPVNLNAQTVRLPRAVGYAKPLFIIYNSNGLGYGLFPVNKDLTQDQLFGLNSPVQRAAIYINAYENMLNGTGYTPSALMELLEHGLILEKEESNLRMITAYIANLYWEFSTPNKRSAHAGVLEQLLWNAMEQQSAANNKKILFSAYQNIYQSRAAIKRICDIWESQVPPDGVKLAEDDYTGMALGIALRSDTLTQVLKRQEERVKNNDRKMRLEFLMPALSPDVKVRDNFFSSLKERKNREKEAWVLSALGYLHHPLRQAASIKYIPQSLSLLEEIQATGDIFFPQSFINVTLGNYQSGEVAEMVKLYIKAHPRLNPKLKGKLLQGADNVMRAQKLVH